MNPKPGDLVVALWGDLCPLGWMRMDKNWCYKLWTAQDFGQPPVAFGIWRGNQIPSNFPVQK
jgi:hypothetical protein